MKYSNAKIDALVSGQISIGGDMTQADWRDLAMAALDQGGMSAADQDKVQALLPAVVPMRCGEQAATAYARAEACAKLAEAECEREQLRAEIARFTAENFEAIQCALRSGDIERERDELQRIARKIDPEARHAAELAWREKDRLAAEGRASLLATQCHNAMAALRRARLEASTLTVRAETAERERDALLSAIATVARDGALMKPAYCGIHQHTKWCQHNGGVLGETGYEAPKLTIDFIECDTCRAKPGSPTLCNGCLTNRRALAQAQRLTEIAVEALEKTP